MLSRDNIFEQAESQARYYCRNISTVFAKALNAKVWDEAGDEYIDFFSGSGSLNYGHNSPAITKAIIEYLARNGILNTLDFHTTAKREFIDVFRNIILKPRGLEYRILFTGPTGTNAVEAAFKVARKATGREDIAAFTGGFHGVSMGALAATGNKFHRAASRRHLSGIVRLPYDDGSKLSLDYLEQYALMVENPSGGIDAPAAFIVETIQGEGGLRVASKPWLESLAKVAKRLGALLIIDDIQAGCGRTGSFFSFEGFNFKPDIVCLAKSIGGNGLPMALILIKPEYDCLAPAEHNGTFRGNNLAFVAANAALQFWQDANFFQEIEVTKKQMFDEVSMLARSYPALVSIAGRGLMLGLRFNAPQLARKIAHALMSHRVICELCGPYEEVLKFIPPLTIEPALLAEGFARLKQAFEDNADYETARMPC